MQITTSKTNPILMDIDRKLENKTMPNLSDAEHDKILVRGLKGEILGRVGNFREAKEMHAEYLAKERPELVDRYAGIGKDPEWGIAGMPLFYKE